MRGRPGSTFYLCLTLTRAYKEGTKAINVSTPADFLSLQVTLARPLALTLARPLALTLSLSLRLSLRLPAGFLSLQALASY